MVWMRSVPNSWAFEHLVPSGGSIWASLGSAALQEKVLRQWHSLILKVSCHFRFTLSAPCCRSKMWVLSFLPLLSYVMDLKSLKPWAQISSFFDKESWPWCFTTTTTEKQLMHHASEGTSRSTLRTHTKKPGKLVHICNLSAVEARTDESLWLVCYIWWTPGSVSFVWKKRGGDGQLLKLTSALHI